MRQSIKIGTSVIYEPLNGGSTKVEVLGIERAKYKHYKFNTKQVSHIAWSLKDYCIFDLSDGHWAYGDQISSIV